MLAAQSRWNVLRRFRPADDPTVVEAGRRYEEARGAYFDRYVKALLGDTPLKARERRAAVARLLSDDDA